MEIKYKQEDIKTLIKKYYQQYEGRDVTVSIKVSKELVGAGYGIFEEEGAVVDITTSEKISLLGITTTSEETIDKDQLTLIFDKLFENTDYSFKGLCYDSGLEKRWEGYGMAEHEVKIPYFNGITLTVERKVNNNRPNYHSQEDTVSDTSITASQGSFQKKLGKRPSNSFINHGNNEVGFIPY